MSKEETEEMEQLVEVNWSRDEDQKQILLPEDMSLNEAITWMERKQEELEQEISINAVFEAYPADGAKALADALKARYGFTALKTQRGFFGNTPPTMLDVRVSPTETVQVPWGQVQIPGVEGYLETNISLVNKRPVFRLTGVVRRKNEKDIKVLTDLIRERLRTHSIYRGKAIRINFPDLKDASSLEDFEPEFLDLSGVNPEELIFSEDVRKQVNANLFTPIRRSEACRKAGIPLKRGVLLAGPYGTGKTMTAYVAAKYAEDNGWTFIYLHDVRDLSMAIQFAKMYAPAVIFAEDLDSAMGTAQRDFEVNDILNTIDGVDSKDSEIIVCVTTNHPERLNKAVLRPGRMDSVVFVAPPDSEAAISLVQQYSRGLLDTTDDYSEVGNMLSGMIPAVIRECVERAKLSALSNMEGDEDLKIRAEDLLQAAVSMKGQLRLLTPQAPDDRSEVVKAADALGNHLCRAFTGQGPSDSDSGSPFPTVSETLREIASDN